LTVPQDAFWGPERTEVFILMNDETGEWLDTIFAEGGVALDKDTKTIAYFGGAQLRAPDSSSVFEKLMTIVRSKTGWRVRSVDGLRGIAEQVGLDPGSDK
jgi:hypothetical protein